MAEPTVAVNGALPCQAAFLRGSPNPTRLTAPVEPGAERRSPAACQAKVNTTIWAM